MIRERYWNRAGGHDEGSTQMDSLLPRVLRARRREEWDESGGDEGDKAGQDSRNGRWDGSRRVTPNTNQWLGFWTSITFKIDDPSGQITGTLILYDDLMCLTPIPFAPLTPLPLRLSVYIVTFSVWWLDQCPASSYLPLSLNLPFVSHRFLLFFILFYILNFSIWWCVSYLFPFPLFCFLFVDILLHFFCMIWCVCLSPSSLSLLYLR